MKTLIKNNKWVILSVLVITIISIYPFTIMSKNNVINHIDANEFNSAVTKNKQDIILIDIRTPEEFYSGHIEGSKLINFYDKNFMNEMNKLDKNSEIYIYCRSGRRSGIAAENMKKNGFLHVYNLEKGIKSWLQEGYNLSR